MRNRLVATFLFSVLVATRAEAQFNVPAPAPGENFHVEVGLMFWAPTPELKLQTGALSGLGQVDLVQEFGFENTRFMEFRAVIKPGRKHKIRIAHVPFEYGRQVPLQRPIVFGGLTLPAGVPVASNVKWDLWRFGWEWDFVAADRGLFGLITEIKRNQVTADIGTPLLGTEAIDVTAPILALGAIARIYPHRNFSVTVEFTGFKVFGFIRTVSEAFVDDLEAKTYDVDLYGTYNFGSHVGIQGGYRSVTAEYLIEDNSGDMKMKGWYFGGLARF